MHTLVSVNRELHIPYIGIPTTYIRYSNPISTELSPVLRRRGEGREGMCSTTQHLHVRSDRYVRGRYVCMCPSIRIASSYGIK